MSSPLDLDATVCGDGGSVVRGDAFLDDDPGTEEGRDDDPYAPAESLRLWIGEDVDWSDVFVGRAAAVLQRDDSTRGAGANPKSAARRSVAQAGPRSSTSAAATRKAVAAVVIGGLPPAAAGKVRCSPCRLGGRARVFAAGEQQTVVGGGHPEEPGSPKVSCLGAVRPEQRPAANGMTSRRALRRSWFAARVACCFSRHRGAPMRNEADD